MTLEGTLLEKLRKIEARTLGRRSTASARRRDEQRGLRHAKPTCVTPTGFAPQLACYARER